MLDPFPDFLLDRKEFPDAMTLGEVRERLRASLALPNGQRCPACTQVAAIRKRTLNSGMAIGLLKMYKASGTAWQHIPTTIGRKSAEEAKLRYWGLIEEHDGKREDGGRAGYWRVTSKGEQFALGRITVPRTAFVYDTRALEVSGDPWHIKDALGKDFDYREVMEGFPITTEPKVVIEKHTSVGITGFTDAGSQPAQPTLTGTPFDPTGDYA